MSVSDVFEANDIPTGSTEPQGIIYNIRKNVTESKIMEYVEPTSNVATNTGNIESIVKWNDVWQCQNNQNAYLLIEFKDMFVFPTFYSLKGKYGYYFAKEWYLYGYNSILEDLTLLSTNTSMGSTYCGDPSMYSNSCCNDNWGTFVINPVKKAFKFFKIMSKTPSGTGDWRIAMRGFEIFGLLSKDGKISLEKKRKTFCFRSCPINNHLPTYAFLRMLSVYLS